MAMFGGDTSMTIVIKAKNEADKVFKQIEKNTKNFRSKVDKMQPAFKRMAVVGNVAFAAMGVGIFKATQSAVNAQEIFNKFDVVFEGVAKEAEEAAQELRNSWGLAESSAKELLAMVGDLTTGIGFSDKAALKLSDSTIKAAIDIASFANLEGGAARATKIMTKALLGEREGLIELGIKISEAEVQTELLKNGQENLTGEMLLQAKAAATLDLIIQRSPKAMGDFARTQFDAANQQRILKERTKELSESLGTVFIPILLEVTLKILPIIEKTREWIEENPKLTKTIITLTAALAALLAVVGFLGLALTPITRGLVFLAPLVKAVYVQFVLLSAGIVTATGAFFVLLPLIILMIIEWEKTRLIINTIISQIKAFGKIMLATGKFVIKVVTDIVQAFLGWKDTLRDIAGAIVKLFKGDFTGAFEDFKNVARKTFDDTISGFAEFGAETQRIMEELDAEVMEYAELWEQSNVDNKLAEISAQMDKTGSASEDLASGAGGALGKMSKETAAKAEKIVESIKKISDEFIDVGTKIKDLNKQLLDLSFEKKGADKAISKEAAEAIVAQEEKVAATQKEINAETDFAKREALKNRLAFEKKELERYTFTVSNLENEIAEVRRRNSLSDIARTFEDLRIKQDSLNIEFAGKKNKIQAELFLEENKFKDLVKLAQDFSKESLELVKKLTDDKIEQYNREIKKINELADAIRKANTLSLSSGLISIALPSREHGGTVPGPVGTAVPILAHGQEQVIPANQTGRGVGGGLTVNVINPVYRNNEDERRMKQQLDKYFRPLIVNHKLTL